MTTENDDNRLADAAYEAKAQPTIRKIALLLLTMLVGIIGIGVTIWILLSGRLQ